MIPTSLSFLLPSTLPLLTIYFSSQTASVESFIPLDVFFFGYFPLLVVSVWWACYWLTSMVITVSISKQDSCVRASLVEKKHVDVTRTIPSLGLFSCVNEEGHVQRLVIYLTLLVKAIISKGWAVNAVTACRVSCGACCSTCCPRGRLVLRMLTAPPAVCEQALQLFCYSRNVSAVKEKKCCFLTRHRVCATRPHLVCELSTAAVGAVIRFYCAHECINLHSDVCVGFTVLHNQRSVWIYLILWHCR